jgi:hypothetical protein
MIRGLGFDAESGRAGTFPSGGVAASWIMFNGTWGWMPEPAAKADPVIAVDHINRAKQHFNFIVLSFVQRSACLKYLASCCNLALKNDCAMGKDPPRRQDVSALIKLCSFRFMPRRYELSGLSAT